MSFASHFSFGWSFWRHVIVYACMLNVIAILGLAGCESKEGAAEGVGPKSVAPEQADPPAAPQQVGVLTSSDVQQLQAIHRDVMEYGYATLDQFADLRRMQGINPRDERLVATLDLVLTAVGDYDGLYDMHASIAPPPRTGYQEFYLGYLLNNCGRHQDALEHLLPLIENGDPQPEAVLQTSIALASTGDNRRAVELLDQLPPNVTDANPVAVALIRAQGALADGDADTVLSIGARLLSENPELMPGHLLMARAYQLKGETARAKGHVDQLSELKARSRVEGRWQMLRKALIVTARAGRYGEAAHISSTMIELAGDPVTSVTLYRIRSQLYRAAGRAEDAQADRTAADRIRADATRGGAKPVVTEQAKSALTAGDLIFRELKP